MTDLEIATEMTTEILKDQGNPFIVGNRYKITGGKYKKYKFCNLVKINDTYSDVCIESSENKPGTESPFNTIHSKVKNCYLYPEKNPVIIEMPDASDLQVVSKLLPEHDCLLQDIVDGVQDAALTEKVDTLVEEQEGLSGKYESVEGVDYPDGMPNWGGSDPHTTPTMTEALANREELIVLKQENDELKDNCLKYVDEIKELTNAKVYANAQAILDSSDEDDEPDVIHNLALTIASLNKELDEYKAMIYGINKLLNR